MSDINLKEEIKQENFKSEAVLERELKYFINKDLDQITIPLLKSMQDFINIKLDEANKLQQSPEFNN